VVQQATRGEVLKLRHRDAVRLALVNRLGLQGGGGGLHNPHCRARLRVREAPGGRAPAVTLRLLAIMEYVKETLAELDAEAAMLPGGEES
jgi:hypothetical protein